MYKCIRPVSGFMPGEEYRMISREYGKVTLLDDAGRPRTIGAYLFAASFEKVPAMKYYQEKNAPKGGKLVNIERNQLNPLPGLSFVSIAYYKDAAGDMYGVIF